MSKDLNELHSLRGKGVCSSKLHKVNYYMQIITSYVNIDSLNAAIKSCLTQS